MNRFALGGELIWGWMRQGEILVVDVEGSQQPVKLFGFPPATCGRKKIGLAFGVAQRRNIITGFTRKREP